VKTVESDVYAAANARFRSPTMVARTFVPPEQFRVLTRASHTVMVGPRGSGKTTLLKMLTPEALEAAAAAKRFRLDEGVRFTGVFVPSDIAWSRQVESLESWNIPKEVASTLFEASFTASVLRNFAAAIHERLTRDIPKVWLNVATVSLSSTLQEQVARELATVWGLELRVPSFLGLRAAASERIAELGRVAATMHRTKNYALADNLVAGSGLISELSLGLDILEALVPDIQGERWCLLFDELELAPAEIRRSLMSAMRSVDERLIFKLALSPYSADLSDLVTALGAMAGHDHDEIWLSYGHKADALQFSYNLMHEVIRERLGQDASLESVLGDALFPIEDEALESPQETSTQQANYVRDLYDIDRSFQRYVDASVGGVEQLLASTGQERAQHLRKIMPLVIVRVTFRTPDDSSSAGNRRYRSRKNPNVYAGTSALAAILEGNPRWIIGLMNALLDHGAGRVASRVQTLEIARTRNRFRALLSTIPVSLDSIDTRRGLLSLIDRVGQTFRQNIIAEDFTPDPVGTFTVDGSASDALLDALGSAINTGAIVYVPESDSSGLLTSMKGKRFRLSYLLATGYQLPLRLQRASSLRAITSKGANDDQLELFADF
jgi:ABC-type branched-subunit amino acid transport system ATPase component